MVERIHITIHANTTFRHSTSNVIVERVHRTVHSNTILSHPTSNGQLERIHVSFFSCHQKCAISVEIYSTRVALNSLHIRSSGCCNGSEAWINNLISESRTQLLHQICYAEVSGILNTACEWPNTKKDSPIYRESHKSLHAIETEMVRDLKRFPSILNPQVFPLAASRT